MSLRRRCALWTVIASVLVGALAAPAVAQSKLPDNWQSLPAKDFAPTATEFLASKPHPSAEQTRAIVQHAWDKFLATEAQAAALDEATIVALSKLMRSNGDALAPYGSPLANTIEDRLFAIDAKMRGQFAKQDFSTLMGLWSDQTFPRHRLHRRPSLLAAGASAAAWMANNDWQALSPVEKSYLAEFLVADLIDRDCYSIRYNEFSIRWTGTIRAPAAGNYRLGQLRHMQRDGSCRIVIGDKTILDTFAEQRAEGNTFYWSTPVTLSPQNSVPIQIEYSFSIEKLLRREESQFHLRPYPMMVLFWESEGTGQQLVPASALAPPADAANVAKGGLLGTYFNGPDFGQQVATRIDPQLDFVWYMAPVLPRYPEQFHAVLAECLRLMTDPQATTAAERQLIDPAMWFRVANMCDFSQRRQIFNWLVSQPEELARASSYHFGNIFAEVGMLPGRANLDLLYAWDKVHPFDEPVIEQPVMLRQFYANNHYGYDHIGAWLTGSRVSDLNELIATSLSTDDGRPRLNMICIAANALTIEQRIGELQTYLQEQIAAAAPGDDRASWLIADALSSECFAYQDVKGSEGASSFAEARQEAKTLDVQFQIECQLAIREICQGLAGQADARLTAAASKFTQPQHGARIAELRATADRLAPLIAAATEARASAEAAAAKTAHVNRLRARMERAQARGDVAASANYGSQLDALTTP